MKSILALCFLMACTSLCSATYNVTSSASFTDITSQCLGSVDCWVPLAGNKTAQSIAVLPDSDLYMVDTAQGCVWSFAVNGTKAWTQQTAWGCGWSEVTTEDNPTYGLLVGFLKTDAGCPSGTKRFYWSYSGGVPGNTGACATHWYTGTDGSELQLTRTPAPSGFTDGHSFLWDGAAYYDIGTGWTSGAISDSTHACAIKGGQVYLWNGLNDTFEIATTQPFPASGHQGPSAVTCTFSINKTSGNVLFIVTGGGLSPSVKWYDQTNALWATVSNAPGGVVLSQVGTLVAGDQDTIFALVPGTGSTANQINNLNITGTSVTMSIAGAEDTCPTSTCPGYVNHTAYAQVQWPHGGLCSGCGTQSSQSLPASNTFGITATDITAKCSPFYSDPSDPSCTVTYTAYVNCPIAGVLTPAPPPPPSCGAAHSVGTQNSCKLMLGPSLDYKSWDGRMGTFGIHEFTVKKQILGLNLDYPEGWTGDAWAGMTVNACAAGTMPTCPGPGGVGGSYPTYPALDSTCFYEFGDKMEPCNESWVETALGRAVAARGLGYINTAGVPRPGTTEFSTLYEKDSNGVAKCAYPMHQRRISVNTAALPACK